MGKIKVNIKDNSNTFPSSSSSGFPSSHSGSNSIPLNSTNENKQRRNTPQYQQHSQPFTRKTSQQSPYDDYNSHNIDPFQQFFGMPQQYSRNSRQNPYYPQQYYSPQFQQQQQQQSQRNRNVPQQQQPLHPEIDENEEINEDNMNTIPNNTTKPMEGSILQKNAKQYSIASTQTFTKLDTIKSKFNDLLNRVNTIENTTNKDEAESLLKSKNQLAQISGDIDKLQFTGLDAIDTSVLHSGKVEARNQRKQLNHDIEELQQHVQELHKIYGEIGTKMNQHEKELNSNPSTESNTELNTESEDEKESINNEDNIEKVSEEDQQNVESQSTTTFETQSNTEEENKEPEKEQIGEEDLNNNNDNNSIELKEGNNIHSSDINIIEKIQREDEEEIVPNLSTTITTNNEKEEEEQQQQSNENEIQIQEEQTEKDNQENASENNESKNLEIIPDNEIENDNVDMNDWVIEESQNNETSTTIQNNIESTSNNQLHDEKDEIIQKLKQEIQDKDKLILELQNEIMMLKQR